MWTAFHGSNPPSARNVAEFITAISEWRVIRSMLPRESDLQPVREFTRFALRLATLSGDFFCDLKESTGNDVQMKLQVDRLSQFGMATG